MSEKRNKRNENENEDYEHPIEQVRNTIPATDDPTLPVFTFRTLILGPLSCIIISAVSQIGAYRQNLIDIPNNAYTLILAIIGKLMAATLPTRLFKIPGTNWSFTMNPGPFNVKENVVLNILSGVDTPAGLDVIIIRKIFYHRPLSLPSSIVLILSSQMLGYGFVGLLIKFLVDNPYMWYPFILYRASFFSIIHDEERRPRGGVSKLQLFMIVTIVCFAYGVVPVYLFPSISALSIVCWFWKSSVIAQIIGSGRNGLGIGSFALDWNAISGVGNPLIVPFPTIVNMGIGFILVLYILAPIMYWNNVYDSKKFPFLSYDLYDKYGQPYNTSKILSEDGLTFDQQGYDNYSTVYSGAVFTLIQGFNFAVVTATLSEFIVFHGREFWQQLTQKKDYSEDDIHNRLMKKYDRVPQWWFLTILILSFSLSTYSCVGNEKEIQLPYWGFLLACVLVLIFTVPMMVILATTGTNLNVLGTAEKLVIGYVYPGKPVAYLVFGTFCSSTEQHMSLLINNFKLGQYMKIPPKSIFLAQITGSMISSSVALSTMWWIFSTVENICDAEKLPKGSPWTCPGMNYYSFLSVTWGLVGPGRIFFPDGLYSNLYYFFLIGLAGPVIVWILIKLFPNKKWIKQIDFANIFGSAANLIYTGSVNFLTFMAASVLVYQVLMKFNKSWWDKYIYDVSNGLDLGAALQVLLTTVFQQITGIYGIDWWGLDVGDHCPLTKCPTAPGVSVHGCPVVV